MKFVKDNIFLILIIILAIVLRFVKLANVPVGFNDDEAAFGYNAYSILKYGFDEWGRTLPFPTFESFGDWKLVFYLYLTVIAQAVFGLNEFATRFPSALFGVLTVIATYFLSKELFKGSEIKLEIGNWKLEIPTVALLLVAISPWQIVASRNAFESDLLSFFITVGTYFFIKSIKEKKYFVLSTMFFVICFYTYRSAWLFVPLYLTVLIYLFREHFQKAKNIVAKNLMLAIVLLLPLLPVILSFKGQSRFMQESFVTGVSRVGITNNVNERRGVCQQNLTSALCSVVYNKYVFFAKSYTSNYIKNLSYETFFENSSPTGFQSFMTRSAFYLFELPILAAGLIFLLRSQSIATKVLIPWLLLVPVGAAITGIGNYGRINLIIPAPQIIAAFGLMSLLGAVKKFKIMSYVAVFLVCIVIALSLTKLVIDVSFQEPFYTSRYQRYGYKQLFNYLASLESNYNQFVISKKIDNSHQYIQYLYFQKIDSKYLQENAIRPRGEDGWVVFDSVGKYKFVQSVPSMESIPEKSLLVVGEKEVSFPVGPIHTISYLNGDRGFEIYDVDQVKTKLKEDEK